MLALFYLKETRNRLNLSPYRCSEKTLSISCYEIVRLRLDCIRANAEPELLGESDQAIEYLTILAGGMQQIDQDKLLDQKDREYVDFLFCYRNLPLAKEFLNRSVIPALCAKAGVPIEDAKGRITGHRGRSTRLTLLRSRGVSLDELAEYAGQCAKKEN